MNHLQINRMSMVNGQLVLVLVSILFSHRTNEILDSCCSFSAPSTSSTITTSRVSVLRTSNRNESTYQPPTLTLSIIGSSKPSTISKESLREAVHSLLRPQQQRLNGAGVSWSFCCPLRVFLAYHPKFHKKFSNPKFHNKNHIMCILCYMFTKKNTPKRATRKEFSAIFFFAVHWPVGGPWLSVATPEGGGPRFGCRCTYRKLQAE